MTQKLLSHFSELSRSQQESNKKAFSHWPSGQMEKVFGRLPVTSIFSSEHNEVFKMSGQHLFTEKSYERCSKPKEKNIFKKIGENHFSFEISDLSPQTLWDLADHPWVSLLSDQLANADMSSTLSSFFDRDWGEDCFSQFFRLFLGQGILIEIPEGQQCSVSVSYNLNAVPEGLGTFHWLVSVGDQSQLQWSEDFSKCQNLGLSSIDRRVDVGRSSRVQSDFIHTGCESGGSHHSHLYRLAEAAELDALDLSIGNKKIRVKTSAVLAGEKSRCHFSGLTVGRDRGFSEQNYSVEHRAPNTQSNQYLKSLSTENCRTLLNSQSIIGKGASGSGSGQLIKNIILDQKSQVYSKPELQVYNDDVSANHGVTFGQMDPEQFFYLRARGVSATAARTILLKAFVDDILTLPVWQNDARFKSLLEKTMKDLKA